MSASIVVIARNEENTIEKCIRSLLNQTLPCEIIVVDGNSTDRTQDIVRKFPVKLVRAPLKDSYGISRNIGVNHASGDVILFQDADDIVDPTWCEKLVSHFDSGVGIVMPGRTIPDRPKSWYCQLQSTFGSRSSLHVHEPGAISWKQVTTKGSAFLKKAILDVGGFDTEMYFGTEDKELAHRISKKGYLILLDPSIRVKCKPASNVREYLSDNFYREGMGHGYVRKKHGVYRPSLSGVGSLVLILLSLFLATVNTTIALFTFLLAITIQYRLLVNSVRTCKVQNKLHLIVPFFFVKWFERVLQFIGFSVARYPHILLFVGFCVARYPRENIQNFFRISHMPLLHSRYSAETNG